MDPNDGFVYQPLQSQSGEIRLLDIQPADKVDQPLRATLRHARLHDASYSALSYVWGQAEREKDLSQAEKDLSVIKLRHARSWRQRFASKIHRHDEEAEVEEKIGSNLARALRCMRQKHKTVTIWADALCINQNDPDERSSQVALMRDIYSQAATVCAWLGSAYGEDTTTIAKVESAFEVCRSIWTLAQTVRQRQSFDGEDDWLEACFTVADATSSTAQHSTPEAHSAWAEFAIRLRNAVLANVSVRRRLADLSTLSRVKYFTRIWILQEGGRARALRFYHRHLTESYKPILLGLCVAQWFRDTRDQSGLQADLHNLDTRFHGCLTARTTCRQRRSLQEVLEVAYLAPPPLYIATDPRDLVYARLGLAHTHKGFAVVYDKTEDKQQQLYNIGKVYARTSRFLLRAGTMMMLVTFKPYAFQWRLPLECYPSWAYDWSEKGLDTFVRYRASKDTTQQVLFVQHPEGTFGEAMIIKGIDLGPIQCVGSKFSEVANASGFSERAIRTGRMGDKVCNNDDKSMQRLDTNIRATMHSLGITVSDKHLDRLYHMQSFPLASFWTWWLSWIAQIEGLVRNVVGRSAGPQTLTSVSELIFREATGTFDNDAVTRAFGGTGSLLALVDLGRWWSLLFGGAVDDRHDEALYLDASPSSIKLMEAFFRSAWGMRCATLETGRLGYVPEDCESQDEVVIFYGVRAPLVIREKSEGTWQIIGPAHVCGAMDGRLMEAGLRSRSYTIV